MATRSATAAGPGLNQETLQDWGEPFLSQRNEPSLVYQPIGSLPQSSEAEGKNHETNNPTLIL